MNSFQSRICRILPTVFDWVSHRGVLLLLLYCNWEETMKKSWVLFSFIIIINFIEFVKMIQSAIIASWDRSGTIDHNVERSVAINPLMGTEEGIESCHESIKDAMKNSSFFSGIGFENLDKLAPFFTLCQFHEGQDASVPMLRYGEDQHFAGIIVEGCLTVMSTETAEKPLYVLGKDDTIGETLFAISREGRQAHNVYVRKPGKILTTTISHLEELNLSAPLVYKALIEAFVAQCIKRSIKDPNYQPITRERINKKFVALIAHDAKKGSLQEFAVKHYEVLKNCNLTGTATTSLMLLEKANLKTSFKVPSGPLGGDQSIGALIANDCIDAVIFFKDPLSIQCHYADIEALCELCDVHNIPCATNIFTAELMIRYLDDLNNKRNGINCLLDSESIKGTGEVTAEVRRRSSSIFNFPVAARTEELDGDEPDGLQESTGYSVSSAQEDASDTSLNDEQPIEVTMDIEELSLELKEIGVMKDFNDIQIELISEMMQVVDLTRGAYLFREDEDKDSIYVVMKGRLEIVENGGEFSNESEKVVASVRKGDVYGVSNLTLGQVRSHWNSSAVAARPTRVAILKRNQTQVLARRNKDVYGLIYSWQENMMSERCRKNNFLTDLDTKFMIITCDDTTLAINSLNDLIERSIGFFNKHKRDLIAPSDISKELQSSTKLKFAHTVLAPVLGGAMELGDLVCRSRIKGAIVFRDRTISERRFEALLRLMDLYAVPVATNPSTADIIVRYFDEK